MPVFKVGEKLCYFSHVPKCGGSSVEAYLNARFGPIGFLDNAFLRRDQTVRWSRTSPQHIDWASLQHFFPEAMFDAVFAVVRHPVNRIVSAYHFQTEVEGTFAGSIGFSDWLTSEFERHGADPFLVDNHIRPQIDFMPKNCTIFHLEHGLDAIVPYLDGLAGGASGPRSIGHANKRRSEGREGGGAVEAPMDLADLARISEFYARDFARFGYNPAHAEPATPKPVLSDEYIAARDAEIRQSSKLLHRATTRIRRGIVNRLG